MFDVEDGDNNIMIQQAIIAKVEKNSVVVFDETPLSSNIENRKVSYNWSVHENKRADDEVVVIVCLQPLLCPSEDSMRSKACRLKAPVKLSLIHI